jgi:hypothetical protein
VRDQLGAKQNWIDSSDLALLYEGPFPQNFYRILHGRVHHEFRLRHALKGRAQRGLRQRLGALARVPYHAAGLLRTEQRLRAIAARTPAARETPAAASR